MQLIVVYLHSSIACVIYLKITTPLANRDGAFELTAPTNPNFNTIRRKVAFTHADNIAASG